MAKIKRIEQLLAFDRCTINSGKVAAGDGPVLANQLKLFEQKIKAVVGVDEVGRGCLAGPVVAAAVMFKVDELEPRFIEDISELDDSKKLTLEQRERLSVLIGDGAYSAIAECSSVEIDELNILRASLLAMKRAVQKLLRKTPYNLSEVILLVDGNKRIDYRGANQITVIKGDSNSASIAAASVVAKVYRDRLMKTLAEQHPHYHWHSNKGYPSKAHKEAIALYGLTEWHRQTFRWQKTES